MTQGRPWRSPQDATRARLAGIHASTKSALEAPSDALALECAPHGIKVIAVAPGAFRSDFLSAHSIRRSGDPAEYPTSVANVTAGLDAMPGRQIGDPVRGVAAILEIVGSRTAPVLPLCATRARRPTRRHRSGNIHGRRAARILNFMPAARAWASEDIAACANGCGTENG